MTRDTSGIEDGREVVRLMAKFQIERADEHTTMQILIRLATAANSLPGCRGCTLVRNSDTSSPFLLVEEWDSREPLERHVESEGFRTVLAHFGCSLRKPDGRSLADGITLRFSRAQSNLDLEDYAQTLTRTTDP